ncbi:HD domain-containing phosphohydrolase [Pseudoduganella lutea]|uniref:Phosphohydrolase n=1 Tax=Pseudoduganella lutea TaxID=321985 RepID=A0A4V0Z4H5_9BURK|nr:HD domain-containing phosphohydrolase [Pseudoduganella lutea]QBE66963.1 phosphohydrolase [Pseudoduganella lutea]
MMQSDTAALDDAVSALAMTGDLAMGQPAGHSARVAVLAARVAAADDAGPDGVAAARLVARLRWCGATASAGGFARLLGDDVAGRAAMLARTLPRPHPLTFASVAPLARAQCEVATCIARMLGLSSTVEEGLRHAFEHADGGGLPAQLAGDSVPPVVFHVALAGDLEVLSRAHGLDEAVRRIGRLAGRKYPADLARRMLPQAREWLDAPHDAAPLLAGKASLALVADVLELKLPWLAGHARRVAALARDAATLAGLPLEQARLLERAALVHGLGRAAIPNPVWERNGRLQAPDWHAVRRAPYWTSQLTSHAPALADAAHLAAHAYERLDGSGYFRRLPAEALDPAHRLLAAATAWAALRAPRPWRAPYDPAAATALLAAQAGRFDRRAVEAVTAAARASRPAAPRDGGPLTDRELEVLRQVGRGAHPWEAARALRISTGAVRTHVDSILGKLECATRPAAMLKALALGLI